MKFIQYIAWGALAVLSACSPIEDDETYGLSDIPADQLRLTATAIVENGVNSNKIVVENRSAVLSEWTLEQLEASATVSTSAYDTLYASRVGTNEVKFRGYNPSTGNYVESSLQVQVDAITEIPENIVTRLCIGQEGAPTGFGTELDINRIEVIVEKDANGLNGNKVTLRNPNPVLTQWDFGGETSDRNVAELYVLSLGETPLRAVFTLADGRTVEHEFDPVDVQTFTYKPEFLVNLTGGDAGEQTWTWVSAPTPMYGIGGYTSDTYPTWASFDAATLSGLAAAVGKAGEETGSMTFKITGELELSSGRTGTWSFDLEAGIDGWSIGKLYTQGVSILYGHTFNVTSYVGPEVYEYDIVVSTDGQLTLAAPCDDRNEGYNAATFWCFQAVD